MLKKFISKFVMDIFPSVIATIIGAYIVNHYINTKPSTDAPVAASVSAVDSTVDAKKTESKSEASKSEAKAAKPEVKGSDAASDVATAAEPGTAKKSLATDKIADKPVETTGLPADTRRHQPIPHDKTIAKATPAPVPAVAPIEASPVPDERRDANDLARAAIERLRNTGEVSRPPEVPHAQEQARLVPAPVPPLPPAITLASPPAEGYNLATTGSARPPYAPSAPADDPRRPTPPADIPAASGPMNIHAETTASVPAASMPEHNTVADDVLSAAKSVFHAVLPH